MPAWSHLATHIAIRHRFLLNIFLGNAVADVTIDTHVG